MEFQTMRIWKETHKLLRMIAADTGESLVKLLHRLAKQEWERVRFRAEPQKSRETVDTLPAAK